MSFNDFLFNGAPPPSVTTFGTTTNNLPQWYSDYQQGLISAANAIAAQPYQPYVDAEGNAIQRIAGQNEDQQAGAQTVRDNVGSYQPIVAGAVGNLATVDPNVGINAANPFFAKANAISPSGAAAPYLGQSVAQSGQTAGLIGNLAGMGGDASAGSGAFGQALSMSGLASASPYLGQAAGQNGAAAASGYLGQAAGVNGAAAASPFINQAAGMNAVGAASPYLGQAGGINAMGAMAPYINAASTRSYGNVADYFNPYEDRVIDRIGDLGARQLREKLIPAVGDQFVNSGQFGSARMQEAVGRALRDTNESVLAQQSQLANQGYQQALAASQQDAQRLAQLGQMTGQTALGQQQNLGQLGSIFGNLTNAQMAQLGNLGQTLGALTGQYQGNLANIGQSMGNLTNQYGALLGNLGQTAGQLTNQSAQTAAQVGSAQGNIANQAAGIGVTAASNAANASNNLAQILGNLGIQAGQLGVQEMNAIGNIGQASGNLANTGTANMINAAQQQGALGQMLQSMGLKDAAALSSIGADEQKLEQANLDLAFQDFTNQNNYTKEQLNWIANLLNSYQMPASRTTTETAPAKAYQPSGLAQIISPFGALMNSGLAKGGRVSHKRPIKGGLARAMEA